MIDDPAPSLPRLHPLRPLAAEEIELASALVRSAPQFEPPTRFVYLSLVEPAATCRARSGMPPEWLFPAYSDRHREFQLITGAATLPLTGNH